MSTEPLDLDAARALIADLKDACEGTRRGESSDWLKLSVDVARIAPDLLAEIDRVRDGVTVEVKAVGYPSTGDPVKDVLLLITEFFRGNEDKVRAAVAAITAQREAVSDGT